MKFDRSCRRAWEQMFLGLPDGGEKPAGFPGR
jgi:hypothetical protein